MTTQGRIASLSTPAWTLAALAASVESGLAAALDEPRDVEELAERTGLPVAVVDALVEVLATMELAERIGAHWVAGSELEPAMREPQLGLLRDDLRTTLLQGLALFTAARVEPHALGRWRHTDEQLLQAQGRLSASVIPLLAHVLFPHVPGLLDRLGSKAGAFLDVGAGVAAVSIAMCRQYPAIRAVGLEPASAPLELARRNVAAAGLTERIELRDRRVEELDEERAFDVAWLPASFLPADTFATALRTVHRALRPGRPDPHRHARPARRGWRGRRQPAAPDALGRRAPGPGRAGGHGASGGLRGRHRGAAPVRPPRARPCAPSGMMRRCTTTRHPPSPCAA